jgi:hypothetical protein
MDVLQVQYIPVSAGADMDNGWSWSNFCVAGLQCICVLELIWLVTGTGLMDVLLVYACVCCSRYR